MFKESEWHCVLTDIPNIRLTYLHSTTIECVVVVIFLTPKSVPPKRRSLGWFHHISMTVNPCYTAEYYDNRDPQRAAHD